jgi:hypothetical protein
MVYGSTPGVVCSAALAIASLTYPEPSPENLMPFVAVTDPRYQGITSCPSKGLIAGFSNPIALQRSSAFDLLFTTGFDATTDGLTGTPKTSAKRTVGFEKSTSSEIRHFLYMNNCKVAEAVSSCLDDLGNANPYAAFVGQVDADSLADHLLKQNVALTVSAKTFAMKLLRSELFARIWKERCSYAKLIGSLKEFSADEFCTGIGEHELIDFYSMVREVKKTYGIQNEEIGKWIERDLQTITMYLSPDLILAP